MTGVDVGMLVFVFVVAAIGLGWFVYEMRSEDEK